MKSPWKRIFTLLLLGFALLSPFTHFIGCGGEGGTETGNNTQVTPGDSSSPPDGNVGSSDSDEPSIGELEDEQEDSPRFEDSDEDSED